MKFSVSSFLWVILITLITIPVYALEVPALTGRVVDQANMLSVATSNEMTASLAELENNKGAQIAVLTIPSLEGESLEDYSLRVAENWKLGQKGVDNGVLLLVARDDRKIRIEVGYGLEEVLTDLSSRRIIDNLMTPAFRAGDFEGGIKSAVSALIGAISGESDAIPVAVSSQSTVSTGDIVAITSIFTVVMLPFVILAIIIQGSWGWFIYLFLLPFFYSFSLAAGYEIAAMVSAGWLVIGGLLRMLCPEKWRIEPESGSGGGSGWSGSSGSSGGGGFSGGGGSFGGGGASGGW